MRLDEYLTRLGLAQPLPVTAETLRRIHVAHLGAFPFHNLAIQRGELVDVTCESIEQRFFTHGGGGYCFEHNTLLGTALRELGFDVTTLLGRVGPPNKRALNHMLLRVEVDGEAWVADVGFGGEGPLEPLPLRDGARVMQDGIEFSLRRNAHHWSLWIHYADVNEELYEFSDAPHTTGDVQMANHYTSTHPASIFRRSFTIQRITPDERLILRPKVVTRYRNGVRTDTPIEPRELRRYARELFGIELGEGRLLFEESEAITIRNARAEDIEWILALVPRLHEFGPPRWRAVEQMNDAERADLRKALASLTDETSTVIVAESNGAPLGFLYAGTNVDFFTNDQHAHIKDIVVAKEGEGRGVGKRLLTAAEEWAKSRAYRVITLSVFPANRRAVETYKRAGYETDVLRMLKVLR